MTKTTEYPKVTESRLNEIRFRAEHGMDIASPDITSEWIEEKLKQFEISAFFQEHKNDPEALDIYLDYHL